MEAKKEFESIVQNARRGGGVRKDQNGTALIENNYPKQKLLAIPKNTVYENGWIINEISSSFLKGLQGPIDSKTET